MKKASMSYGVNGASVTYPTLNSLRFSKLVKKP